MRPRNHYIVWEDGRVTGIVRGAAQARKRGPAYKGFTSRLEAEEFAAWWNFREDKRRDRERAERAARISTTERTA